jgi:hypothetical protein
VVCTPNGSTRAATDCGPAINESIRHICCITLWRGVQFYLTNDGGAHWAQVTPGVTRVFTTTGSDLRWRAMLSMDPIWNRTPVVNSLRIEYST